MTLSREFGQGQHEPLREEIHADLLDRVGQAGWAFAGGGGGDSPYQIGIVRLDGRGNMAPEDAIERLRLAGEGGQLLPGYEVATDDETGRLALGYEGPGDGRYVEFLFGVAKLGHDMDQAAIQASPYPEALEQWRQRHLTWAVPRIREPFEPHISPSLKALRDHVVFEEGGVARLQEMLAEFASSNTIASATKRERLHAAVEGIEVALAADSAAKRDDQLDLALQVADGAIKMAVEYYETRALGVPGVVEAFAREALVDNPSHGSALLSEAELRELLEFEDSPVGEDGSGGTKERKTQRAGRILYELLSSVKPRGIHGMFTTPGQQAFLGGKTFREVIDSGSIEENEALLDWAMSLRGMPVT